MAEYELYHSHKGSTWKNHKYTGKKTVNGKTVYLYGKSNPSKETPDENSVWTIGEDGKYYIDGKEVSREYFEESYENALFKKYWNVPKELQEKNDARINNLEKGNKSGESVSELTEKYTQELLYGSKKNNIGTSSIQKQKGPKAKLEKSASENSKKKSNNSFSKSIKRAKMKIKSKSNHLIYKINKTSSKVKDWIDKKSAHIKLTD